SGWMKYSYTRSGGASICTEAVTSSAVIAGPCGLVTGFHDLLEPLQVLGPELGEEVPQRGEPFGPHRVQAPLAVRALSHQASDPEHLQVQGDGLLGDVELPGDLVDRARPVADQPQDRPSAQVGKGLERCFAHGAERSRGTRIDLYKRW